MGTQLVAPPPLRPPEKEYTETEEDLDDDQLLDLLWKYASGN
jgi:hypothetical protein